MEVSQIPAGSGGGDSCDDDDDDDDDDQDTGRYPNGISPFHGISGMRSDSPGQPHMSAVVVP